MEPTTNGQGGTPIYQGDQVLVSKRIRHPLHRGDLVLVRLGAGRLVALSLLRRSAAGAGQGSRADLLRAFLERLRRRPETFRA